MESIARLITELPKDYEHQCYAQGALRRRRGVSSPSDLMMLCMFHLHNGCSLLEISEVARITKLGSMSDVAFMKRFEQCGNWFRAINEQLASEQLVEYQAPSWLGGKALIAIDATDVREKSRSARTYRLHYALDILKMTSVEHKITTNITGESLCNFTPQPDTVIIADRCYSTIKGIKHCVKHGADYILRLRKNSFTVREHDGTKIDLNAHLATLNEVETLDLLAFATNSDGEQIPIRICASRKTPEAIKQTHKRLKRQQIRRQRTIADDTKTFNEFIVLITNLNESISATDILETYRLRWQVEIYFKRLKSILDFGELPKRRHNSIIAWLNGKLMIALLIERIISVASFSPQDD